VIQEIEARVANVARLSQVEVEALQSMETEGVERPFLVVGYMSLKNRVSFSEHNNEITGFMPCIPTLPIALILYRKLAPGLGRELAFHGLCVPSNSWKCLSSSWALSPLHSGEEHWNLVPLSCRGN
jgi:hypothetical protein